MPIHLDLELPQIMRLVDQLEKSEKAQLARYLDDQTLFDEFQSFVESKRDVNLSYDQITEEVRMLRNSHS